MRILNDDEVVKSFNMPFYGTVTENNLSIISKGYNLDYMKDIANTRYNYLNIEYRIRNFE